MQIPQTKQKPTAQDRFDFLVDNIILYMELTKQARIKLGAEKRLTQELNFKMITEINFIVNVLKNLTNLTQAYVMGKARSLVFDEHGVVKKQFQEDVIRMCDELSPPKPMIITGQSLDLEMRKMAQSGFFTGKRK